MSSAQPSLALQKRIAMNCTSAGPACAHVTPPSWLTMTPLPGLSRAVPAASDTRPAAPLNPDFGPPGGGSARCDQDAPASSETYSASFLAPSVHRSHSSCPSPVAICSCETPGVHTDLMTRQVAPASRVITRSDVDAISRPLGPNGTASTGERPAGS